jgi:hypothetical protein
MYLEIVRLFKKLSKKSKEIVQIVNASVFVLQNLKKMEMVLTFFKACIVLVFFFAQFEGNANGSNFCQGMD